MARLTERVRCIACTHYTTETKHIEGCSHIACPQRKPANDIYARYEEQVLRPLKRKVMELCDQHMRQESTQ